MDDILHKAAMAIVIAVIALGLMAIAFTRGNDAGADQVSTSIERR